MIAAQLIWLGAISYTRSLGDLSKLPGLAAVDLGAGLIVLAWPRRKHPASQAAPLESRDRGRAFLWILTPIASVLIFAYALERRALPDEPFMIDAMRMVANQGLGPFFQHYAQIAWLGTRHPPLMPVLYG